MSFDLVVRRDGCGPRTRHDRHRANPFTGHPLRDRIARTIRRGRTSFLAGRITAEAGGRLLTPSRGPT